MYGKWKCWLETCYMHHPFPFEHFLEKCPENCLIPTHSSICIHNAYDRSIDYFYPLEGNVQLVMSHMTWKRFIWLFHMQHQFICDKILAWKGIYLQHCHTLRWPLKLMNPSLFLCWVTYFCPSCSPLALGNFI